MGRLADLFYSQACDPVSWLIAVCAAVCLLYRGRRTR
jgi:hypothetical protein